MNEKMIFIILVITASFFASCFSLAWAINNVFSFEVGVSRIKKCFSFAVICVVAPVTLSMLTVICVSTINLMIFLLCGAK